VGIQKEFLFFWSMNLVPRSPIPLFVHLVENSDRSIKVETRIVESESLIELRDLLKFGWCHGDVVDLEVLFC